MVTIKFYSILKRYNDNKNIAKINIKDDVNIKYFLEKYEIIPGEVGVILLNSNLACESTKISDGDVLELFPVFGGG